MVNRDRPFPIRSANLFLSPSATLFLSVMLGSSLIGIPVQIRAQQTSPRTTLQRRSTQFTDLSTNHPASLYIIKLAEVGVIKGFPDQSFRPEDPVTRAQFAAILRQAFPDSATHSNSAPQQSSQPNTPFSDVPNSHWALSAIQSARASGFLAGYPGNQFRPEQNIPRVQALVSLNNGLGYVADQTIDRESRPDLLTYYQDSDQIPDYAIASLRSATQSDLVVSYPAVTKLNPNRNATRAEVAAFVYQAMAKESKLPTLANAPYAVTPSFDSWKSQPDLILPATGRVRLSSSGARLLLSNANGFQIWETRTGAKLVDVKLSDRRLNPQVLNAHDIAINAAENQIAAVTQIPNSNQFFLHLWDAETGNERWQVSLNSSLNVTPDQLESLQAKTVEFSVNGSGILVDLRYSTSENRSEMASLRLHDVQTGAVRVNFALPHGALPQQVALSPNGRRLVGHREQEQGGGFRSQFIDIWPLNQPATASSGQLGESIILSKSPLGFREMAFTQTGALRVLSQHLYDIRLDDWDLSLSQRLQTVRSIGDVDRTDSLGILSPDGDYYFVRSDVAGTRLINTKTYKTAPLDNIAQDATFDGQGEILAIATPTQIEIFRKITP